MGGEAAGLDTRTFTIPVQRLAIGDVSPDRLRQAWSTLVARHEALRTFFAEDENGELRRKVASSFDIVLESETVSDCGAALAHIRQRQAEPLSMRVAPLWRLGLVDAREDGECFFWLALHHSVGDGQSIGILLDELTTLLNDGALHPSVTGCRTLAARNRPISRERTSTGTRISGGTCCMRRRTRRSRNGPSTWPGPRKPLPERIVSRPPWIRRRPPDSNPSPVPTKRACMR